MQAATEWDQFVAWYAIYPRREARADAWRAWQQTRARRPVLDVLITSVQQHAAVHGWCAARRQYIPMPATWLRGERWADEFDVPESVLPALPAAKLRGADAPAVDHALVAAANAAWAEVRACNGRGETRPLLGWSDPRTEQARAAIAASLPDMGARNAHLVQREFVAAFCAVRLQAEAPSNPNVVPLRRRA
jgi:hypothetical protein